jgi:hypothetical protein
MKITASPDRFWVQLCHLLERIARRGICELELTRRIVRRRVLRPVGVFSGGNRTGRSDLLAAGFGAIHLEVLSLLKEERAIRLDLLAKLLGVPLWEARRVVELCVGLDLASDRRFLVGERHPWVWLNGAGALALGYGGCVAGAPGVGSLARLATMARVRAYVCEDGAPRGPVARRLRSAVAGLAGRLAEASGYVVSPKPSQSALARGGWQWISERDLLRREGTRLRKAPDALLEGRHETIAIVIDRPTDPTRLAEDLTRLARTCDFLLCFCSEQRQGKVEATVEELSLPNAIVRGIPGLPRHREAAALPSAA